MNKTIKLLTALIVVLAMLMAFIPANVFADETYTLTINGTVANREFEIYKIFDATATSTANQYAYAFTTEARNYFVSGNPTSQTTLAGAVEYLGNLANDASELYTFAADYVASTVTTAVQTGKTGTDAAGVVISGLTPGYYLVHETTTGSNAPTPVSSNILIPVVENTTVNLKAVTDTISKEVDVTTASVGDTVTFTVTTVMPNTSFLNYAGSPDYTFTITDTMSEGLDYIADSIVVKVGEGTEQITLTVATDYTVANNYATTTNQSANEVETLVIGLGAYAKANPTLAGQTITITYDARINENAVTNSSVSNTVKYDRSKEEDTSVTEEIDSPDTPEVYVINADFTKKSALGNTLNGATFELYYSADGTTYTKLYVINTTGSVYMIDTHATSGNQTITGGNFKVQGLKEGYYKLVETSAPTLAADGTTPVEGYDNKNFDGTNNNAYIFQVTYNDTSKTATMVNAMAGDIASYLKIDTATVVYPLSATSTNTELVASLLNSKASALPSTGGMGTVIFTVIGIAIMASVIGIVIYRNKKNS